MNRPESRGLHYTLDFPKTNVKLEGIPTILDPMMTYHAH
jgi:L-aspartate oxidase